MKSRIILSLVFMVIAMLHAEDRSDLASQVMQLLQGKDKNFPKALAGLPKVDLRVFLDNLFSSEKSGKHDRFLSREESLLLLDGFGRMGDITPENLRVIKVKLLSSINRSPAFLLHSLRCEDFSVLSNLFCVTGTPQQQFEQKIYNAIEGQVGLDFISHSGVWVNPVADEEGVVSYKCECPCALFGAILDEAIRVQEKLDKGKLLIETDFCSPQMRKTLLMFAQRNYHFPVHLNRPQKDMLVRMACEELTFFRKGEALMILSLLAQTGDKVYFNDAWKKLHTFIDEQQIKNPSQKRDWDGCRRFLSDDLLQRHQFSMTYYAKGEYSQREKYKADTKQTNSAAVK